MIKFKWRLFFLFYGFSFKYLIISNDSLGISTHSISLIANNYDSLPFILIVKLSKYLGFISILIFSWFILKLHPSINGLINVKNSTIFFYFVGILATNVSIAFWVGSYLLNSIFVFVLFDYFSFWFTYFIVDSTD